MTTIPAIFIVTADDQLARSVCSAVDKAAPVEVAPGLSDIFPLASMQRASGLIVDCSLGGPTLLELSRLRAAHPLLNMLLVARELRPALVNHVQSLRIELVAAPIPAHAVGLFVRRALSASRLCEARIRALSEQVAITHELNETEVTLFPFVLGHETAEAVCARLEIDPAVMARTLRRLLKKCKRRNADRLAKDFIRAALLDDWSTVRAPRLQRAPADRGIRPTASRTSSRLSALLDRETCG